MSTIIGSMSARTVFLVFRLRILHFQLVQWVCGWRGHRWIRFAIELPSPLGHLTIDDAICRSCGRHLRETGDCLFSHR